MQLRSLAGLARLATILVVAPMAMACSDDDDGTTPTSPLVGTWNATSFTALGSDFIADGMDLSLSLTSSGGFTMTFTNDLLGACDPGPNCTQTGTWTETSSTITVNFTDGEPVTFTWAIQGSTMTWTGVIDSIPVTIVFTRS